MTATRGCCPSPRASWCPAVRELVPPPPCREPPQPQPHPPTPRSKANGGARIWKLRGFPTLCSLGQPHPVGSQPGRAPQALPHQPGFRRGLPSLFPPRFCPPRPTPHRQALLAHLSQMSRDRAQPHFTGREIKAGGGQLKGSRLVSGPARIWILFQLPLHGLLQTQACQPSPLRAGISPCLHPSARSPGPGTRAAV